LDSFVPDEKADRINNNRTLGNEEYAYFATHMISTEIRIEMDDFIVQARRLGPDDPLYHQRVYTLIGLEYSPTIEKSYLDAFLGR